MEACNNWISHPQVCRCCLANIGIWNLTKDYVCVDPVPEHNYSAVMGEVLADRMRDCFGISLSYLYNEGVSQLVCDVCASQLRSADEFRKQVQTAEQRFSEYINKEKGITEVISNPVVVKVEEQDNQKNKPPLDLVKIEELDIEYESSLVEDESSCIIPDIDPVNVEVATEIECKPQESSSKVKQAKSVEKKTILRAALETGNGQAQEEKRNNLSFILPNIGLIYYVQAATKINCKPQESLLKIEPNKSIGKTTILKAAFQKGNGQAGQEKAAPSIGDGQAKKEKKKIFYKNTSLNQLIRFNTALILKNSTVLPFTSKRNNNGKYTCLYCETNFLQIQEMRKHVEELHEDITVDEIVTRLKSPVFKLAKAELSHVRCKICGQDLQNLDNLMKHLIEVHEKKFHKINFKPAHGILAFILESETPTCYECRKEFPFFQALVSHMSAQHGGNYACDKCDKNFFLEPNLLKHVVRCHGDRDKQTPPKYKCKFCDEMFHKSGAKQNHMKKVHGHGTLKCVECGAAFSEHKQRVRHFVEVHNYKQPQFKCDLCPRVFTSTSNLSSHMRTHRNIKIPCNICGKTLTSKQSLRKHLLLHSEERLYACQFCGKRFKGRNTLVMHERGHLNDKRYVCEVCKAAFIQIHTLRRHYMSRHPDCGVDLKSIRAKKS